MNVILLIILTICCWDCTSAVCKSPKMVTINKRLGSSLHFQCKATLCNDMKYNYTHYNPLTGEPENVIETSASKCTQKILSFDYGGNYCCHSQCGAADGNNTTFSTPECCINVAILPVFQWSLPNAVALNGNAITGSCSATGYPRPDVRVIIPAGCDYRQNYVHVGNYTAKAMFTINVTRHCETIYCLATSKSYSVLRTNKLTIVDNVFCGNGKRQTRSIPMAIKTSVSKEGTTKNTRNNHEATTYARGSSVTTAARSMMIIITVMLILLMTS